MFARSRTAVQSHISGLGLPIMSLLGTYSNRVAELNKSVDSQQLNCPRVSAKHRWLNNESTVSSKETQHTNNSTNITMSDHHQAIPPIHSELLENWVFQTLLHAIVQFPQFFVANIEGGLTILPKN